MRVRAGPRGVWQPTTASPRVARRCCGGAACRGAPSPWASPTTASGPMQVGAATAWRLRVRTSWLDLRAFCPYQRALPLALRADRTRAPCVSGCRPPATRPEQRVIIGACIIVVFTTTVGFGVVTQHVMELLMPTPPPPQPPPQRPQQLQQHAAKRNSAGRQGGALRPAGYGRQSGPADVDVRQPLLSPCGSSSELTQPCASNGVHGVQGPTSVIPTAAAAAAAVVAAVAAAEVSAPPAAALGATMAVVSSAPPLELSNDMLWAGEVLGVPAVPRVAAGAGSATADMGATGGAGAGTAAAPVQGGGDVGHGAGGVGGGAEATLLGMEDLDEERTWVHRQWRRFDATWLQPVFGGRRAGEGIAGLEHV